MSAQTNTYRGPNGWTLVADRREVFPDNPGNGTPLMVYGPRMCGWGTLGRVANGVRFTYSAWPGDARA